MAITHPDGTQNYVGMVIGSDTWYNSSIDIMSYYAIAYNIETRQFDRIYVYCDFPSDKPQDTFTVDATDEIKAIYTARQQAIHKAQRDRDELIDIMTPSKGKTVEVIRGRKVPHGTTGIVFWMGNNGWGMSVGFKDATEKAYFTAINNVQVI